MMQRLTEKKMYDAMIERETLANYLEGLAKRCGQLHKFSTPAQRLEHIATIRRAMDILSRGLPGGSKADCHYPQGV